MAGGTAVPHQEFVIDPRPPFSKGVRERGAFEAQFLDKKEGLKRNWIKLSSNITGQERQIANAQDMFDPLNNIKVVEANPGCLRGRTICESGGDSPGDTGVGESDRLKNLSDGAAELSSRERCGREGVA